MLVQGDGEVYFIDRDNSVFQANGLIFPHVREDRCLRDTLMDGVSYITLTILHYINYSLKNHVKKHYNFTFCA